MTRESVPELGGEPGWSAIEPIQFMTGGETRSFVSGDPASTSLRVRYFRREDGALVGKVWFGPGCEGPPQHAHGGSLAAVMDEALGAAAWLAGHPVLAARLTTHFRRVVPLGTVAQFETKVTDVQGRKIFVWGRIASADGQTYCDADGLFIRLDPERSSALAAKILALSSRSRPQTDR